MKLDRLQEYVTTIVATAVGIGLAYYLAIAVGQGQIGKALTVFLGVGYMALMLSLRQYVWILIPITWQLTGAIQEIKGAPALRDAVVVLVAAGSFMLVSFKIIRKRPRRENVDFWMLVMLVYMITVYVRNPVGFEVLNSDQIGGRAYYGIFIAGLACWVLIRGELLPHWAGRVVAITVGARMLEGMLSAVANWFPETVPYIARFYTGIDTSSFDRLQAGVSFTEVTPRQLYLAQVGMTLGTAMVAVTRPLRLLNPLNSLGAMVQARPFREVLWFACRQALFFAAIVFVLLSGFRSNLAALIGYFAVCSYLARGAGELVRLAVAAVAGVLLLIMVQMVTPLPAPMQRALSFLPGNWATSATLDAQQSSEWRYYMWKQMLFTDRYLSNKWLGDGFGFSYRAFQQMKSLAITGGVEAQQENLLITGQVHSGPISTIRYAGYVGLILYTILMVAMARYAWRLCRRAQSTPYRTLTFFIAVPVVWEPIQFYFIFGAFDNALAHSLFQLGMMKMLMNSLELYEARQTPPAPHTAPRPALRRLQPLPASAGAAPALGKQPGPLEA